MAETNPTRKDHWGIARKGGEWGGERYEKNRHYTHTQKKFYYGEARKKLQQKPFTANFGLCSSFWPLKTMHQNLNLNLNKIQIPVLKMAFTLGMGERMCVSFQCFILGTFSTTHMWSSSFLISIVIRTKILCTLYITFAIKLKPQLSSLHLTTRSLAYQEEK